MKQEHQPNLFFLCFFVIGQILDIITTIIGINLGATEINPIGFNLLILILKLIMIFVFIILFYLTVKLDKIFVSFALLFCLTLLSVFFVLVIINNIFVIMRLI